MSIDKANPGNRTTSIKNSDIFDEPLRSTLQEDLKPGSDQGSKPKFTKNFTALVNKNDDMYVAECYELGITSQGYSIEEAIHNIKEAAELYLENPTLINLQDIKQTPIIAHFVAKIA